MGRSKKGFSIVELIVVIAVIAVLAAVLIPAFFSMVKNARISADNTTVTNLNKAVATKESIDSFQELTSAIEDVYGLAYLQSLAPVSAVYGNHFWFDNSLKKVILSTIEDLEDKGDEAVWFNCPNSNIVDGYTLLDAGGSDLADLLSGVSNICSKTELNSLANKALSMYNNGETYLENLVDYLSHTVIINSNGSFRFENLENVFNVYFPSDYVSLGTQILYTYDINTNTTNIHKTSLGYPLVGDGMYGAGIEIKKTMYFGTRTFLVEEDCNIVLICDVDSVEDLKTVFAAAATNAYVALASAPEKRYVIVGDVIQEAESGDVVADKLEYSVSEDVINYSFPYTEAVTYPIHVERSWLTGKTTSDTFIAIENSRVSIFIPKGVKVDSSDLTLTITPLEISESNFVVTGYATASIDVHVEGVSKDNTVPLIICIGSVLPRGLNISAVKLYHIENGDPVLMKRFNSIGLETPHNSYSYNPSTGEVIVALKSFSEVEAVVAPSNVWNNDDADTTWYYENINADNFHISTAAELAGLAQLVNNGNDSFEGKTIYLDEDIVINDWKIYGHEDCFDETEQPYTKENPKKMRPKDIAKNNDVVFYDPCKTLESQGLSRDEDYYPYYFTPVGTRQNPFKGSFDGQNHTVYGLFDIDCWHDGHSVGLFNYVYGTQENPITIENINVNECFVYSEYCRIGLVACNATGNCTFQNIKCKENHVSSYNEYVGGIIGNFWYIKYDGNTASNCVCKMNNCVVDDTNTLSALWGTYDCILGGLIGGLDDDGSKVYLKDCMVYCTLDAYNDCCANYQWFQYRYCGMLIGWAPFSDVSTLKDGVIFCEGCTVAIGDWNQYYYYKWPKNGKPSYAGEHDWKYSRYSAEQLDTDEQGNVVSLINFDDQLGKTVTSRGVEFVLTEEDLNDRLCLLPLTQLFGSGNGGGTVGRYGIDAVDGVDMVPYTDLVNTDGQVITTGKITKKWTNSDYIYRVGNVGEVKLGSLFMQEGTISIDSEKVNVTFSPFDNDASAQFNKDSSNWTESTIKFSGTGVITLKLSYHNKELEYILEIVDAKNITSAENAIDNNVVLLNGITVSQDQAITVSNGYAFYGNGFEIECDGKGSTNSYGGLNSAFILITDNSILDNAQIKAIDFPKAYMYASSSTYDYCVNETENKVSDNHYAYQLSAVKMTGNSVLSNSHIYGARNNVLAEGNVEINNCILVNGSLANIHFASDKGSLTLNNVTTIQYRREFEYNPPNQSFSKKTAKVIGLGILMGPKPEENVTVTQNASLIINGDFNQYNWICDDYSDITSSRIAKEVINSATGNNNYKHTYNGNRTYVNLGVVYLNDANAPITDNRPDGHGYAWNYISMSGISGISGSTYSLGADYGVVELKDEYYKYIPTEQCVAGPLLIFDGDMDGTMSFERNKAAEYSFTITLEAGQSYDFDVEDLKVKLFGQNVGFNIKDEANTPVTGIINLRTAGTNSYIITAETFKKYNKNGELVTTDNKLTFEIELKIIVTLEEIPDPVRISDDWGSAIKALKDKSFTTSSDWTMAVAPFDGLKIKYWSTSQNQLVTLDLTNLPVSFTNIENNNITINGSDYSVSLESTAIKDKCTNTWAKAGNKLFVTAKTGDYVSKNTPSRTTTITYTFTDSTGHSITFDKRFDINKPAENDTAYNHANLINGTLQSGKVTTSCLAPGTMILMADGTEKQVQYILQGDELLVFNHETGEIESSFVLFNDIEEEQEFEIINLDFSNGKRVRVISEHGFFDLDLMKYVYIDGDNYADFVGHRFYGIEGEYTLDRAFITYETMAVYSPVTYSTLNYFTEGMLSMPGGITGLFNIFDYDNDIRYDQAAMNRDIETYGLFTAEEMEGIGVTEIMFNAYNGKYLKIALGKGILTEEHLMYMIERYGGFTE